MNTNTMTSTYSAEQKPQPVPATPRGRALHTVDWFLNGKPVLRNHDNPQLSITGGCHC